MAKNLLIPGIFNALGIILVIAHFFVEDTVRYILLTIAFTCFAGGNVADIVFKNEPRIFHPWVMFVIDVSIILMTLSKIFN